MTENMQPQPTKGQILEQQSAEERVAFAAFKKTYMERVPLPHKPATLDLRGLGFEFWLYFGQALTSILLAAMRTSDAFYFVGYATTGQQIYASAESLLSVLVVELGMVVFAAILAQKHYKDSEAKRRKEAEDAGKKFRSSKAVTINSFVIWVGLILMALISMSAGLHQSVRIIKDVDPMFVQGLSYGLGIAIGIGITVIAVIAGDILGQQLAIVTAGFQDRQADYEEAMEVYHQELEDSWARSDERRYIRAEVRAAAKNASSEQFGYGSVTNNFRTNGELRRPPKQTERVFQYMDQIYQTEKRIPSFSEVMDVLQIAKATASEARSKWLTERGISEVAGENGHGE